MDFRFLNLETCFQTFFKKIIWGSGEPNELFADHDTIHQSL